MVRLFVLLAANLAAPLLVAAQPSASLSGTVASARARLSGATVRAKNVKTGAVHEVRTAADGTYKLPLPPATYDLFITVVGHGSFAKRGLAVAAGSAQRIDATLAESQNEGTPGEIFYLHLREEAPPPPKGPAPRTRQGKPDFSGVWFPGLDLEPEDVPFLPWAADYARTHTTGDDPRSECLPSGVARGHQMELAKFIQTPSEIVVLFEGSPPGFRQIFLDGRAHPKDLAPTWMGHSTAKWEGDTLVVDTVGFNDRAWIDFNRTPQTEQLHIIERYTRTDLGHLDMVITIDDPGAYSRPWKMHRILTLAQGEEIQEYICNENNFTQHLVH